jgi:hypothetical protein
MGRWGGLSSVVADAESAADWIANALSSSGYRADFSAESLWEVDRFLDEQSRGGAARRGGLLAEDLGSRLFALGAYTGEVIRRSLGGEWSGDDDDPEAEVNVELRLPDGSVIWPVQRVMKRFSEGEDEAVAPYAAVLGVPVGDRPQPEVKKKRWFRS